jgi:hypothetical protein
MINFDSVSEWHHVYANCIADVSDNFVNLSAWRQYKSQILRQYRGRILTALNCLNVRDFLNWNYKVFNMRCHIYVHWDWHALQRWCIIFSFSNLKYSLFDKHNLQFLDPNGKFCTSINLNDLGLMATNLGLFTKPFSVDYNFCCFLLCGCNDQIYQTERHSSIKQTTADYLRTHYTCRIRTNA